jgi:D-inositol-3-phosphate glycosyltransferase
MNVLQIPRRFVREEWGGTETVVLETTKRLRKKNIHSEIFTSMALAKKKEELIDGTPVKRFPYFYPYLPLNPESKKRLDQKGGNLFSFSLAKALLRYPNLNLIHLHTGKRMGGIVRYVAQKREIPYIVSLHGGILDVPVEEARTWTDPTQGTIEWGKLLGWWVGSRKVLDDAAVIMCVGQEEQKRIQKQYSNKNVIYLPNGVDCSKFAHGEGADFRQKYNIPPDAQLLLTVGRIDPQKNQKFLLEILPAIIQKNPDIHLLLIGHVTNDSYYEQLQQIRRENHLKNYCTILTGLDASDPDLINAYHAADLFLLPSVHEPFGIVILEAWASGLPVIASRVGGIPYFVSHETDGILLPPNDRYCWIQAISESLRITDYRKTIAYAGREKVLQYFDWDCITDQLISIYHNIL